MSDPATVMEESKEDFKCKLEFFEGPLDLLLYLIKKNEIDINNLKMETITSQYLEYINMMQTMNVDIASEFIVTAATLLYIKTKWLLPIENENEGLDEEFDDPRLDLLEKLLEYKKFKEAGEHLGNLHDEESSSWKRLNENLEVENNQGENIRLATHELYKAVNELLKKKKFNETGEVHGEKFSVDQKIQDIRKFLSLNKQCNFHEILGEAKNKEEVICLFLGILELIKLQEIIVEQSYGLFSEIIIKRNQLKLNMLEDQN